MQTGVNAHVWINKIDFWYTYIQFPNPLTAYAVLVKWSNVMKRRTYFVLLPIFVIFINLLFRWWFCVCWLFCKIFLEFFLLSSLSNAVLSDIIFVTPVILTKSWLFLMSHNIVFKTDEDVIFENTVNVHRFSQSWYCSYFTDFTFYILGSFPQIVILTTYTHFETLLFWQL